MHCTEGGGITEAGGIGGVSMQKARNKNALDRFTAEQRSAGLFRMIATAGAGAAASDRDEDLRGEKALAALRAALERLRPDELRVPGGFDARGALQALVDNGEDGDALLRRLERHSVHLATVSEWSVPFYPRPVCGVMPVSQFPKLCMACLEARQLLVLPLEWDEGPQQQLKNLILSVGAALGADVRPTLRELQASAFEGMRAAMDFQLRVALGCPRLQKETRGRRGFLGRRAGGPELAQTTLARAFILQPHVKSLDGSVAPRAVETHPPREMRDAQCDAQCAASCAAELAKTVQAANEGAREARRRRRAGVTVALQTAPRPAAAAAPLDGRPASELGRASRRRLGAAQVRLQTRTKRQALQQAEETAAFLRATAAASSSELSGRTASIGAGPSLEEVERRLGAFLGSQSKAAKHRAKREAKKLGAVPGSVVGQLFLRDVTVV